MLIKNNENINSIKLFKNFFLYTAYADNSTFFLKDKNLIKELLNTINYFSSFTGLKLNLSKCVFPNQIIDALQQLQNIFYGIHLPRK